jgi:hypothetical protein
MKIEPEKMNKHNAEGQSCDISEIYDREGYKAESSKKNSSQNSMTLSSL